MRHHPLIAATTAVAAFLAVAATPAPPTPEGDASWVPSLPTQPQGQVDLDVFTDGTGYAMRSNGSMNGPLLQTADAGITWTPATTPPFESTGSVAFSSPDLGYGLGFGGDLHRTQDGAATWQRLALPVSGQVAAGALEVVDGGLAVGITHRDPEAPAPPESCTIDPTRDVVDLAVSRDQGANWDLLRVQDTPGSVRALAVDGQRAAAITSDIDWQQTGSCRFDAVGAIGERVVVKGEDRFSEVFTCPETSCWDVAWVGDHLAVLTIEEVIILEQDGDVVSRAQLDGALEQVSGLAVQRVPDGLVFVDDEVGYASIGGNGIWRTDDGGRTWTAELSPVEVPGTSFGDLAVAGDLGLAGGANAVVRRVTSP